MAIEKIQDYRPIPPLARKPRERDGDRKPPERKPQPEPERPQEHIVDERI